MLVEDISMSQILTAMTFIAVLIILQIYIKRNKNSLKGKFSSNRRIILTDTTNLSPTEKVQIIQVDNLEYLYFFSKGNQPVIMPLNTKKTKPLEPRLNVSAQASPQLRPKSIPRRSKEQLKTEEEPKKSNRILQAISIARKQNPKVSFE